MTRAFLAVLCVAALVLCPAAARAQGAPELRLTAEANVVGLGDDVHVTLSAMSITAEPGDVRLATPGFTVRGHNALPSQTHVSVNGTRFDRYTLAVDWVLHADRLGSFTIGPASVLVGDKRYSSTALQLRVVPAGTAPASRPRPLGRPSPFPFPNMTPFGNLFPDFNFEPEPPPPPAVTTDSRLALDAPRGAVLFLHAAVDKTNVVVGEQVDFSVYIYVEADEGTVNEEDAHEASADDFMKHALLPEDQEPPSVGFASVGGKTWQVHLLRRWALFPLHAGDLPIGPMTLFVRALRLPRAARSSEALHVHVTEPPMAGRPPGYAVGDVGHFTLAAQVQPREVEQGAAVGVHVELTGSGNVPSTLPTPARADVDWFPPEVHEKIAPTGDTLGYGGTRSFDFVVRVKRPGQVDLGELRLPFWNPDQRRYEVARAALGIVNATPSPGAAVADAPTEILTGLPAPRDTLAGLASARRHADDSPLFWWLAVAGGPLAFGMAVTGRAAGRRGFDAWRARRTSPVAELRGRVAAARAACDGADARGADAAVARALEAAVVAHAGISVRGAVGDEVVERLARAGVAQEAASNVAELLRECETARFSPDAADVAAARGRWSRAQGVIRRLEKGA